MTPTITGQTSTLNNQTKANTLTGEGISEPGVTGGSTRDDCWRSLVREHLRPAIRPEKITNNYRHLNVKIL
jgi:hypothetical protein